jgi:hypothetical protein
MSEIEKYKKYLNFKANPRYLRRDFMVPLYTGTEPDIVSETNIDPGMVVDPSRILPKNFTDDMPFVTDQNNPEQLELADGGSVERQGFAPGGPSKLIGRYKIDEKKLNNLRQYLKSLPKDEIILASSLQKKFDVDRETIKKIVTREFSNKLKLAGPQGSSINIKKVNIEKAKRVEENISKIKNDYVKDLKTKFKYPSGSFKATDAGVSNSDLAIKYFGSDNPTNIARVERLNARFKNEYGLKYPKGSTEETSLRRLERKEESRKYLSDVEKDILKRQESQKKLLNNYFKNNPKELLKNEKLKSLIDVSLTKEGDLDFTPRYKTSGEYINLAKEGKLFDVFHTSAVKGEKRNIEYPVNRNIGPSKFNQGFIKQIETFFERTKDDSKYDLKKQEINNYLDSVGYRVQVPDGTYIGAKALSAIDSKTGRLPNIEKTLENLNLPKLANTSQYIPPKKISQFIGSIGCPTYAVGGRVNFSEGSDCYNKGLKKLEEGNLSKAELNVARRAITTAGEEGSFLKNILDKAGSGIKFTGVTFDDLMAFGRTPGGRLLGYGVGVGLPAYFAGEELLKGNIKQAGRELGYIPTLGFGLPESLVGSVKTDLIGHAKEKGFNVGSIEKILNKNEISKKINAAEELLGYGKEANLKNPEKFNKPIQDKIKSLYEEYDSIKLNNADQENLNKTLESFYTQNRERVPELFQARTKILENVQKDIGSFKRSELDPAFAQEEKINIPLEKIKNPVETVPEELPSEYKVSAAEGGYIDYMRDYNRYASGGRIHLNEGGGGPKLSRRGFLGFLAGAAASPFVIKAMKGKKLLSGAKVATKVLPKVSGMPDWFNPLVTRIMNEGVDISPKAERVEDIVKVKKLEFPMPEEGTTKFRKSGSGFEKKNIETITMTEYPDGRIEIEADVFGGSFDAPFSLNYRPPKTDINVETGEPVKYPGDFSVVEQRPKPDYGDPGNFEIDYEVMSVDDTISDLEKLEKIGTGKRIHPKRVEQRTGARKFVEDNPSEDIVNRYGDSEIEYDRMKDEGLFNETE